MLPLPLGAGRVVCLLIAGAALSAASFHLAAERGRSGAGLGLLLGAIGACASRWPALARALEFRGEVFLGPFLAFLLPWGLAGSAALAAMILVRPEAAERRRLFSLALAGAWVLPTWSTEAALTRRLGYGPRSLAEAAGIPPGENKTLSLFERRLADLPGAAVYEEPRLSWGGVALSARNLRVLEAFLKKRGFDDVFSAPALEALRRGWRRRWDIERALNAMSRSFPGEAPPDYVGALDLIKAGPLTPERYARLKALDAKAAASSRGFENLTESQLAFEGFAAAYARFSDEDDVRRWLARLDNLWPVNEKPLEVTPLQDFHRGRVVGTLLVDGLPGRDVRVGLFMIWTSTGPGGGAPSRLLSESAYPDEDGRFVFRNLGAGRYELALLAPAALLRGRVIDEPGTITLGASSPSVVLPPIRVERWPRPGRLSYNPSR